MTPICKKACNSRSNSYRDLTLAEILMAVAQNDTYLASVAPNRCAFFWLLPLTGGLTDNYFIGFLPTMDSKLWRFMCKSRQVLTYWNQLLSQPILILTRLQNIKSLIDGVGLVFNFHRKRRQGRFKRRLRIKRLMRGSNFSFLLEELQKVQSSDRAIKPHQSVCFGDDNKSGGEWCLSPHLHLLLMTPLALRPRGTLRDRHARLNGGPLQHILQALDAAAAKGTLISCSADLQMAPESWTKTEDGDALMVIIAVWLERAKVQLSVQTGRSSPVSASLVWEHISTNDGRNL